jgi:hypothetical protein
VAETNVPITPGAGANIAGFVDPAGNVRQAMVVGDPVTGDVAGTDGAGKLLVYPPEVVALLTDLKVRLGVLLGSSAGTLPDAGGRTRVLLDAISSSLTLATVSTVTAVGTVNAVTTVGSVSQVGGQNASLVVQSLMNGGAGELRRQITVT